MNYHNIKTDDMLNGDGLRVTLFISGCKCRCNNCHNPQAWNFDSGIPFTEETVQEILSELAKPYISGLTLSGGHPLETMNVEGFNGIAQLVQRVKKEYPNKTIWVYSGWTWEEILKQDIIYENYEINVWSALDVLKYCDVLVDGRYVEELRDVTYPFAGSRNQRIIDIKKSLAENKVVLWQPK